MHDWSDDKFDWNALWHSVNYCIDTWRRYGRIGSHGKEKYGCYDSETKVLTKEGWKLFENISDLDEFATLNKNDELEYQKSSWIVNKQYAGPMYKLDTRGVSLLVTPDHNLWFSRADSAGGYKNCKAKKFKFELQSYINYFKRPKKFNKGAKWNGKEITHFTLPEYKYKIPSNKKTGKVIKEISYPIKPWLHLLGWIVAEGSIQDYQLDISLDNTDGGYEQKIVVNILRELNIEFTKTVVNSSIVLKIYSRQLCIWVETNIGKLAPNKKCPAFIKELSPELIVCFLESLYAGDGHKTKTAYSLSTVSEKLAEDCLELLLKAGYCGRLSSRPARNATMSNGRIIKGNYRENIVNWLKKTYHTTSNSHDTENNINKKEKIINYTGKIYCIEVPNHIIYVMRDGKPVWCGNSFRDHITLWDGGIWSFFHPGHVYIRPGWKFIHFKLDYYIIKPFTKYTGLHSLGLWWQSQVYNYAVQKMCKKYPHIIDEIVSDLDGYKMVKPGIFGKVSGEAIHNKYWRTIKPNDKL